MTSIHVQMLWYRMQRALEPEIWYEVHADEVLAAATLGGGVDRLLEEWSDKGQILDSYAADCLAMEALQCLYGLLEDELVKTNAYIERYQFPDPEEEGEKNMAYILKQLQCSETIGLTDEIGCFYRHFDSRPEEAMQYDLQGLRACGLSEPLFITYGKLQRTGGIEIQLWISENIWQIID